MNAVTQNIRMQAALIHAVQPVHEAQDMRPPSPLPWGLCQLSKNNMCGDALFELQKLTEKGNLQARHTLQPGLQIPRAKGAPDLTAIGHCWLDNSIKQAPYQRKGLVAMKVLKVGNLPRGLLVRDALAPLPFKKAFEKQAPCLPTDGKSGLGI